MVVHLIFWSLCLSRSYLTLLYTYIIFIIDLSICLALFGLPSIRRIAKELRKSIRNVIRGEGALMQNTEYTISLASLRQPIHAARASATRSPGSRNAGTSLCERVDATPSCRFRRKVLDANSDGCRDANPSVHRGCGGKYAPLESESAQVDTDSTKD